MSPQEHHYYTYPSVKPVDVRVDRRIPAPTSRHSQADLVRWSLLRCPDGR